MKPLPQEKLERGERKWTNCLIAIGLERRGASESTSEPTGGSSSSRHGAAAAGGDGDGAGAAAAGRGSDCGREVRVKEEEDKVDEI